MLFCIPSTDHIHITRSHMRGQENAEECVKIARIRPMLTTKGGNGHVPMRINIYI